MAIGVSFLGIVFITELFGGNLREWFLASVGVSLLVFGVLLIQTTMAFALSVFLLLLGNSAQLYVSVPLWYNELIFPPQSPVQLAMYILIAMQLLGSCVIVSRRYGEAKIGRILSSLGTIRLTIFVLLSAGFSVSILNFLRLGELQEYFVQIGLYSLVLVANFTTICAIAICLPGNRNLRLLDYLLDVRLQALFTFFASAFLCWFSFERIAHVSDEVSYMFQAQTYAGGALWVEALPPEVRPAFDHFQISSHDGRWFSVLAPGWPAVLSVGVLAGIPWLINPLMGAVLVMLTYAIASELFEDRYARLSSFLVATSPWVIAMSASLMTHPIVCVLVLLAWRLLLSAYRRAAGMSWLLALCAGASMGWVFLTRPLDGLAVGISTGIVLIAGLGRARYLTVLLPYCAGCALIGGLVFPYNDLMTGDPLAAPMAEYFEQTWVREGFANRLGFGPEIGPPSGFGEMELITPGHSVYEASINTLNNFNSLHTDLFGWGIGSLAFFWFFWIWSRPARADYAMAVLLTAVFTAYFFYWFSGSYFIGPRYWYVGLLPLVYFTVRGLQEISERLKQFEIDNGGTGLLWCVVILSLVSATVFLSYRGATRYHHHRGYHGHFRNLQLTSANNEPAPLVFYSEGVGNHGSAIFLNDPFLSPDRPVFAKDLGEDSNQAVMSAFPDRPVLHVTHEDLGFPSPY